MRRDMLAALAVLAGAAIMHEPPDEVPLHKPERSEPEDKPPGSDGPVDGRLIRVPQDVFQEVLKEHSLQQINAMPYAERLPIIEAATARIEARKRAGAGNEPAAQLREERARRKAEAWAKRQPKASG